MTSFVRFLTRLGLAAAISGCATAPTQSESSAYAAPADDQDSALAGRIAMFEKASLVGEPSIVECILSGGTKSRCLSVTLKSAPASFKIGPWCPRNVSDGPDVSGIWLDSGKVFDADGAFIQNLANFYQDEFWQLYDPETGKVRVTDTRASCAAAARPDVDPDYQNYCVECQISYVGDDITQTYVIPLEPVMAEHVGGRVTPAGVGVAFSGVRLDAAAPTDQILNAHTLAPFDDCGGHVNLHVGYHLHAVTDCLKEVPSVAGHAPEIGIAMDGHGIHSRLNLDGTEPGDLDACRGHTTIDLQYHYHVNAPGKNAIIGCHVGETGCVLDDASAMCDASRDRRGPPPPRPG